MKTKKVLIVANVELFFTKFLCPYIKYFKDKGYIVEIATKKEYNEEQILCDKKYDVNFPRSLSLKKFVDSYKQMKKILHSNNYEIIFCHTPFGAAVARFAIKSCKLKNTRVIYMAHGFHFFNGASLKYWLLFYPIEKYLSKFTDDIITINNEDYIRANQKFNCKVHYLRGVGLNHDKKINFLAEEKKSIRKKLGIKESDFVMIFPGELNHNKNQLMLIKSLQVLNKKYNNIHLLLPGNDIINGEFQKYVKDNNVKNVHFLGFTRDIPLLLSISNLALSSSKREGLPVNIMESMEFGLPIIATDCRGNRDLVINGRNGFLVKQNDFIEMAKRIEDIYLRNVNIEEFSKFSKQSIKKYYISNIINDFDNILNENTKENRVLHLLSTNKFSGAENVVCQIIDMYRDDKNFCMWYCSPKGSILNKLDESNIKYIPISKLSYFEIKKIIKKYKPTIIHAHDVKASIIASLFFNKTKIVSHIHGNSFEMRKKTLKSYLFNIASKKIAHIYWVSESSLSQFYYKKNIYNKSTLLPNIISINNILNKSNEFTTPKYDIIFVGRLNDIKDPNRLVKIIHEIIKQKSNCKAAILGDGILKEQIKEYITNNKLEDSIKLYGFITNPYPYMKNSKVMLMTSKYEGTPMCAIEAMTLGLPIISTPVDGLIELINNGVEGYLESDDKKIIKHVLNVLEDEKLQKYLSQNAIKKSVIINNINSYKSKLDLNYIKKGEEV